MKTFIYRRRLDVKWCINQTLKFTTKVLIIHFRVPHLLRIFWLVVPGLLDCLNCFWFFKMMKGLIKALKVKTIIFQNVAFYTILRTIYKKKFFPPRYESFKRQLSHIMCLLLNIFSKIMCLE